MKKISALILAAALASSAAPAQTKTTATDSVNAAVSQVVKTEAADTISVADTDADCLVDGQPVEVPSVSVKDGKWAVAYDGADYIISDLIDDSKAVDRFRDFDDFEDFENFDADTMILKDNMGLATVIIAIMFGFPCLTIIVGLIVIFAFALKRNRGRNELINNAIDHNYQLPDVFYVGQKNGSGISGSTRDSRKFYSATTLMAIGLSLIIFAIYSDTSFFILAGGIPFLIGIGQLIGYFCVPTSPRHGQMPPFGGGQPFQAPYPGPDRRHWNPATGQYPGAPQQQPYSPNPDPVPQPPCAPMTEAPSSSSPVPPVQPVPPVPGQTASEQPSGQENRQTPPPYNPS